MVTAGSKGHDDLKTNSRAGIPRVLFRDSAVKTCAVGLQPSPSDRCGASRTNEKMTAKLTRLLFFLTSPAVQLGSKSRKMAPTAEDRGRDKTYE